MSSGGIFAGRIALVTGASRGIGAATALALAGAGAHVVLCARTPGALEAVEGQIHQRGGTATIAPLDITQGEHVDKLAGAIASRWGKVDMLIANAGVLGVLSPLAHIEPATWDQVIATNLTANFRLIRAFDGLLRSSANGRLVMLTSTVANQPRAYWSAYAASKAGMESLADCYADEVRNVSNVRVAVVNPGPVRTGMRAAAFPGENPETLPEPDSIGLAILELLAADFETGFRVNLKRGVLA
jgi:NAD(P)-dependent dehydrogenase (short-subunit alcohol dehydrogenase family)